MANTWTSLLDAVYPVGAVYQSWSSTSPATLFGGTWTKITSRFLYAANSAGTTNGSNTVTLTVAQMPEHKHRFRIGWGDSNSEWNTLNAATGAGSSWGSAGDFYYDNGKCFAPSGSSPVTGGQAHQNMPAYITCYTWRRTA